MTLTNDGGAVNRRETVLLLLLCTVVRLKLQLIICFRYRRRERKHGAFNIIIIQCTATIYTSYVMEKTVRRRKIYR